MPALADPPGIIGYALAEAVARRYRCRVGIALGFTRARIFPKMLQASLFNDPVKGVLALRRLAGKDSRI